MMHAHRPLTFAVLILSGALARADLIDDVRKDIAAKNFAQAEQRIAAEQKARGAKPELAEAVSWLARGALDAGNLDQADRYATQAKQMALRVLGTRKLDADPWSPIAVGAAIEVHGRVLNARGGTPAALEYLRGQLRIYSNTSLVERIQKNINLISLEGKAAPPLEAKEWIGPKQPPSLAALKGKAVLLFFWAHWCPDCKEIAPVLAELKKRYGARGLEVVGPTRYYGYVANGDEAPPAKEKLYIDQIRQRYYAALSDMPAPLSNANFSRYGSSSTPTLVLVNRAGVVSWYHPGTAPPQELAARIEAALK
jgi:thiol-disulfide isomerase/thioredoxin